MLCRATLTAIRSRMVPKAPSRMTVHKPMCVCGGCAGLGARCFSSARPSIAPFMARPAISSTALMLKKQTMNLVPSRPLIVDPTTLPPNLKIPKLSQEFAENGRPISPHIAIYNMSLVAYVSFFTRFTGALLTAGLYLMGAYSFLHWDVPSAITAWGVAHPFQGFLAKGIVSLPFIWHIIGGFRHLYWDGTLNALDLPTVDKSSRYLLGIVAFLVLILMFTTFADKEKDAKNAKDKKAKTSEKSSKAKADH